MFEPPHRLHQPRGTSRPHAMWHRAGCDCLWTKLSSCSGYAGAACSCGGSFGCWFMVVRRFNALDRRCAVNFRCRSFHAHRDFANEQTIAYSGHRPQVSRDSQAFGTLGTIACCPNDRQRKCDNLFPDSRAKTIIFAASRKRYQRMSADCGRSVGTKSAKRNFLDIRCDTKSKFAHDTCCGASEV